MEMGSMGEAKTWLWWLEIRGWRSPPRVRFPPFIYLLGFPSPPFRVPPKRAYRPCPNSDWADLRLKIFVWKIVTTFVTARSPYNVIFEGQTSNLRKKVLRQISGKSQFDSNKVSSCILDNFYTSKSKTRTLCTFATISRLVQINNKLNIKQVLKA